MSKGKGRPPVAPDIVQRLDRIEQVVGAQLIDKIQNEVAGEAIQNSHLSDVLIGGDGAGLGGPPGFPGNQGNPWTPTISTAQTIFRNLRWYLVSNFRQMLSEAFVEIGLIQTIVKVPVEDALRGGIEIKSQQLTPEQVEELQIAVDRDNDLMIAGEAAEWNRLFGGAGILILTDQDPEEPLEIDEITEDTPLEFRACDMWELTWDLQGSQGYDPTTQSEEVEYYSYYGEPVHHSRVMKMTGITAPSFIRPRLRGWGFSVVETLVRSINQYLKANDLAFEVLDEFKVDVYKIKNLTNSLFSPEGKNRIKERVQLANWTKNYQSAVVMDTEDDWDHKQLSFAGLGDAMREIRMQVASDMRMPLTKLFGISATGFNSGEDDIEVYNSMVESSIRNKLKYHVLKMLEIKCQHRFGFIPDDLSVSFKPLRVLSSEQEENVKTQKFARALQARQAGEISSQEFRDIVNKGQLLDIKLATVDPLNPDNGDEVADGPDPDEDGEPGANDPPSASPHAKDTPKGKAMPTKSKSNKETVKEPKTFNWVNWDEDKHPRADDGKFGEGGGSSSGSSESSKSKKKPLSSKDDKGQIKMRTPKTAEEAVQLREEVQGYYDAAMAAIDKDPSPNNKLRAAHAARQLVKSGALAVKYLKAEITRLESKKKTSAKNAASIVKPYSSAQRFKRKLVTMNSAEFDRASYEADGGDAWIDPRRKVLFEDPRGVDKVLWARAKESSRKALGELRWQYIVWSYRKFGGGFNA